MSDQISTPIPTCSGCVVQYDPEICGEIVTEICSLHRDESNWAHPRYRMALDGELDQVVGLLARGKRPLLHFGSDTSKRR